jgi:hypothetical protein
VVLVGNGELLFPAPYRASAGASIRAAIRLLHPPTIIPDGEISPVRLEAKTYTHGVFPIGRPFKRWRAYAVRCAVYSMPRLVGWCAILRTLCSGPPFRSRPSPPRAPWLQRRYPLSSLLRAHGPIPMPPARISCSALIASVPAACTIHGWSPGPSRLWSTFLCWSAAPFIPAARRVHLTSSSSATSAFASLRTARLSASSPTNGFTWATYFSTAGIP